MCVVDIGRMFDWVVVTSVVLNPLFRAGDILLVENVEGLSDGPLFVEVTISTVEHWLTDVSLLMLSVKLVEGACC